jgi:ABC-type antimicrobial peptide transport system permease subunit
VAAVLAATGIYGVMSCLVVQRTREIGIRMALGAKAGTVLMMVGRQAGLLVMAGMAAGIAGAFTLTRVLQSMLYGVTPTDPVTYAGGLLLLALVAAVACLVPARRAATIDPTVALRQE